MSVWGTAVWLVEVGGAVLVILAGLWVIGLILQAAIEAVVDGRHETRMAPCVGCGRPTPTLAAPPHCDECMASEVLD